MEHTPFVALLYSTLHCITLYYITLHDMEILTPPFRSSSISSSSSKALFLSLDFCFFWGLDGSAFRVLFCSALLCFTVFA